MSEIKVYLGPTIEGVIVTGSAWRGGYPPRIVRFLGKMPYAEGLFVDISVLAKVKKLVRTPGSEWNLLYQKVEREVVEHV